MDRFRNLSLPFQAFKSMLNLLLNTQKKEIEPHCGESLCRLFDLTEINDDEPKIAEINSTLSLIIERSKQRHHELLNEAEKKRALSTRSRRVVLEARVKRVKEAGALAQKRMIMIIKRLLILKQFLLMLGMRLIIIKIDLEKILMAIKTSLGKKNFFFP